MLRDILPATKAKMRILNVICNNNDINIRNIIKLSKTSPNLVVKYINKLRDYQLITIRNIGGAKKSYIKAVSLNYKAPLSEMFYTIIEIGKKEELIKKYPKLKPFIAQIENSIKSGIITLIYGSYARFAADKESDLDIWLIGKIDKKTVRDIKEVMVTCPIEYSIALETKEKFLKKIKDPIHQNVVKDKTIITGKKEFFRILAKYS